MRAMVLLLIQPAALPQAYAKERGMSAKPICISGIYPHLAVFNGKDDPERNTWEGTGGECGIGAIVPWAGKLWLTTYPPHMTRGGPDKLFGIDEKLNMEIRPESVGGTHASRMIHRESNQLIIGPYFIDAEGNVRAADVEHKLVGRMTAVARHLKDPARWVYFFDMEGAIYEVEVHTLEVHKLFEKPVPGWHGKGGYTGQGRFIISNNGERQEPLRHLLVGGPPKSPDDIGALAEWDGREWRIVERKQFLDVTGPGGIYGAPDDQAPVWAIGWDRRSVILKLLDAGQWHMFRLPKASHCYDPAHGWYTEWPRIRDVGDGKLMMDMHGMFYDFPKGFRSGHTGGIEPIASHLRYIPDFCDWNGTLVLAADDASVMQNPMVGKSQSNLWFGKRSDLSTFGPRSGWGGPWAGDPVQAGEPSDPFLVAGFRYRCLHMTTGGQGPAPARRRASNRFDITMLPDELAALASVTIARGDYHKAAPGYSFTVDQDVQVYLAVDARAVPRLGPGWTKTDMTLVWGGHYTDAVYVKTFAKGKVDVPPYDVAHKPGAYGLPHMCFLRPGSPEADPVQVTGLPDALSPCVTRAPAPAAPAVAGVTFTLEIDRDGRGEWSHYRDVAIPESGYGYHLFPSDFSAAWLRVTADKDCRATAYLHCSSPREAAAGGAKLFASLPGASDRAAMSAGLIRPAEHNTNLQFVAQTVGSNGRVEDAGYYEVDQTIAFTRIEPGREAEVRKIAAVKQEFTVDAASAIMTHAGRRYRLPKGDAAYDQLFAMGRPRGIRECVSERYLMNIHGTLYEMPRDDGLPLIKPVCTHDRKIMDFCTWRGLMVISGSRGDAQPDGNYFASLDGKVGLWFGAIDDLWQLGKPVGAGGPWKDTRVKAQEPSDAYLMTGYDRKTVELSHSAAGPVTFALEVDFDHCGWRPYATFRVAAGEGLKHTFAPGFSAHWVRVTVDTDCHATAWFVYE